MTIDSRPALGFIGLGLMGKPMARHLLNAGYPLTVFNRSQSAVAELARLGAILARSPAAVAERSDLVMTCLPDSPDVENVVIGDRSDSVIHRAKRGTVVIDFSTISPTVSKRIAATLESRGIEWLDSPVTGGTTGAQNATLTLMVGGKKDVLDRCVPILKCVGKTIVHAGPAGSGHTLKLVNQIVCGIHLEALGEAMQVADKAGLDMRKTLDVLDSGAAGSWLLRTWKERILEGNFAPGFKSVHQDKDLRLALELARELGISLPGVDLVKKHFEQLIAQGGAEEGTHALTKLFLD